MRSSIPVLLAGACVILSGCFTREDPFYEESQVVQDARLPGAYDNVVMGPREQKDEAAWSIRPTSDFPGKYEVLVQEKEVTVTLLATMFRVGTNLFFDLYPLADSGVYFPGDVPTVTQAIRGAMYVPLHVVWKVELSDEGIAYSVPYRGGTAAVRRAPELKTGPADAPERIMIPGTPRDAQEYLLRFKDDPSVFDYKGRLVKRKVDAQRGSADGSQPSRLGTNQPSGAAGSRR